MNWRKAISTEIAFFEIPIPGASYEMDSLLISDDLMGSYVIIRHNIRTYRSDGVIAVVGGKQRAELELKKVEESQDSSDRHEGWRYLLDKTDLKAGTDPAEATQHRQEELEARELTAMRETPNSPSPHRQR
jgi:hypothetical protein